MKKILEQMWSGNKRNLSHLKSFGCRAIVDIPKENHKKWYNRSEEMIFVRYCKDTISL